MNSIAPVVMIPFGHGYPPCSRDPVLEVWGTKHLGGGRRVLIHELVYL